MKALVQAIQRNLPAAKPEVWRRPRDVLKRRLVLALKNSLDPAFAERPFVAKLAHDDLFMEIVPADAIGKAIAVSGIYEFAPTELVRSYLSSGDVFVDVGANVGYYALLAARRVGASGRVFAFEPFPPVLARLQRNVELNALRRIEISACAVGRRSARVHLAPPDPHNQGTASIVSGPVQGGIEAECVPLDLALRGVVPTLVKVDVEGHEAEVFAGMEPLLRRPDAPSLLFESFKIASDRAILEGHGYIVYVPGLAGGKLCLRPLSPAFRSYRDWEAPNFFAVKSERGRRYALAMVSERA